MLNDWVVENESRVYTIVEDLIGDELRKSFPNIRFTTSEQSSTEPVFPTVYIHESDASEIGMDLDSSDVNGMQFNFTVTVTVNTSKSDLKKILRYVMNAFKTMHFRIVSNFEVNTNANMYGAVATFRRVIGNDDALF